MYARVARFEGGEAAAIRQSVKKAGSQAEAGPPEGVPAKGFLLLVDPDNGRSVGIGLFETEDDLRTGDQTLNSMNPQEGWVVVSASRPTTWRSMSGSRCPARGGRGHGDEPYATLAWVYEWLVPDPLLEPEGSVAAFADVVEGLGAGARVLDCAAGCGQLAVGLALRGFDVVASDASRAMVQRTRALAARHGVELEAVRCSWEELGRQGWEEAFDAVFCVGNSLTHAAGQSGRRAALAAMHGALRADGLLALTSRNWERLRAERPGLDVADRLTERNGGQGLVVYAWTIPDAWEERHHLDVAVAVLDEAGGVTTHTERLAFWPFSHHTLHDDLLAAGLTPVSSTYTRQVARYVVTARRSAREPAVS